MNNMVAWNHTRIKTGEAQTQNSGDNNNLKYIHQYSTRKRRLSVIGRYGFRAMSPILEKDEDIHYMNKKMHANEAKIKDERTSAAKPNLMQKRCTTQSQVPLNLNKSVLKFLSPADGKMDARKRIPENQKPRKIKWPKKLRRRSSGQQKTNTVSAKLPQIQSTEETLNRVKTISISFSKKKEKRDMDSIIGMRRNNLEVGSSDSRKNISIMGKHNISSYPKKNKNSFVTIDKKSYLNTLKRCKKNVSKSNYKSNSDNAVPRRLQRQQLRKTLSSPPKFNKSKNTSTRKSSPSTNKFKKMGHRITSNDEEQQQKKETKLLYAKHLLPKTGTASSNITADAQTNYQAYNDTIVKKIEHDCSLTEVKHIQIMNNHATNISGFTFLQETCAQNLKSSESCQKQTNYKNSVFSLGSTAHSLSNLHSGEPPTKAKSKINLLHVSPEHSEKTFNENFSMKSYGINDTKEEHTNSFNITLNKNLNVKVTEDNILNDIIISNSMLGNSLSCERKYEMFPTKISVANNELTKRNLQYNMSHQKRPIKVGEPFQPDNSKPATNTKTSTPLILGAKCALSNVPEKKRKISNCLSTVKYYTHNFKKNNIFPNNTSNAAWILPKSFPHDWLDTQDNIQLERKKSMMSCNIEVVPNSNNYEWRSWF